jgi:hypothetical protein
MRLLRRLPWIYIEFRRLRIYTFCNQNGVYVMKVVFIASLALSGILVPTVMLAQSNWDEGFTLGLATFSAQGEGGTLIMVCDPDRVYNPDASYANFVVTMPNDRSANRIVFLASSGQQASFEVRDGVLAQKDAHPDDWAALAEMIRNGGRFAVVTAQDAFSLDMAALPDFACS